MARVIRAKLAAAGSAVAIIDPNINSFGVNAMMYGSSTINATAQVDATIADMSIRIPVTVSQTTTTVTVTFPTLNPHTLGGTKDYVVISGTGLASIDGVYPLASVTNDTVLTYTSSSATVAAGTRAVATPVRFIETLIASATVSATAPAVTTPAVTPTTVNLNLTPHTAFVLKCTTYVAGTVYFDLVQAGL